MNVVIASRTLLIPIILHPSLIPQSMTKISLSCLFYIQQREHKSYPFYVLYKRKQKCHAHCFNRLVFTVQFSHRFLLQSSQTLTYENMIISYSSHAHTNVFSMIKSQLYIVCKRYFAAVNRKGNSSSGGSCAKKSFYKYCCAVRSPLIGSEL